jgi:hypothetical protein
MNGGYHPIYAGLWNDDALEGLPFEAKGFFAYLCSNVRMRPSGIYRATDEQLSTDSGLALDRVIRYVKELETRNRIVRDGSWMFVVAYFKRQPKQDRLILAVRKDLEECSSSRIIDTFSQRYPLLSRPSRQSGQTVKTKCPTNPIQPKLEKPLVSTREELPSPRARATGGVEQGLQFGLIESAKPEAPKLPPNLQAIADRIFARTAQGLNEESDTVEPPPDSDPSREESEPRESSAPPPPAYRPQQGYEA